MLLTLTLLLSACGDYNDAMITTQGVIETTTNSPYLIDFAAYRDVNTVLYYPKLYGIDDLSKQDRLNTLIFEDAKNVIALFDDDIVCITIDYEVVTQQPELITIKYRGYGCANTECEDGATVYYSSSISITDEKILR